jgi:hypothetical protein
MNDIHTDIHNSVFLSVVATVRDEPWPLFYRFLTLQVVGGTPWTANQTLARPLPKQDNTNTE